MFVYIAYFKGGVAPRRANGQQVLVRSVNEDDQWSPLMMNLPGAITAPYEQHGRLRPDGTSPPAPGPPRGREPMSVITLSIHAPARCVGAGVADHHLSQFVRAYDEPARSSSDSPRERNC